MKHVGLFDAFLHDVVDLNATRIATLEERVKAVQRFLRNADYGAPIRRFSAQGSWAHGTIIRPPRERNEFDADFLAVVDEVEDWEPKDYVNALYRAFSASSRYRDKVRHRTRCVRIDYAGDFHLDIVPCIERKGLFWTTYLVLNRDANRTEPTAPEAYTEWLKDRDAKASGMLRKVTRLAKYQRDVKTNFSVKSILLTTLLGERIADADRHDRSAFADVPTALRTLFGRLDDWLQWRWGMPSVPNPALPDEDLNRHWDRDQYANFRAMVHKYRGWIDDAYAEADPDQSLRKWRKVFGDDFGTSAGMRRESADAPAVRPRLLADLVPAVTAGRLPLASIPVWPHVRRAPWRMRGQGQLQIAGSVHADRGRPALHALDTRSLPKGRHLKFVARHGHGIPPTFRVFWQVVNSGTEADDEGDLRGDFIEGSSATRWERTAYRGVHWVEAFLVNIRTDECLAKSGRLFVVVR